MGTNHTISVELDGADGILLQAGEARGTAVGIREATEMIRDSLEDWRARVIEQSADREEEVGGFLAGFGEMFKSLEARASTLDINSKQELGRAVAAGAGRPRARGLRERVRGAILGGVRGWKGA